MLLALHVFLFLLKLFLILIEEKWEEDMVSFDILDDLSEVTTDKGPSGVSRELLCDLGAIAEDDNFGFDLDFLQKPMK
jgi:hypothetical protein